DFVERAIDRLEALFLALRGVGEIGQRVARLVNDRLIQLARLVEVDGELVDGLNQFLAKRVSCLSALVDKSTEGGDDRQREELKDPLPEPLSDPGRIPERVHGAMPPVDPETGGNAAWKQRNNSATCSACSRRRGLSLLGDSLSHGFPVTIS